VALTPSLRTEYATTRNNILYPAYGGNQLRTQDDTLLEYGGNGWRAYDTYTEILKDCHAFAVMQKRIKAVTSRELMVEPGGTRAIDRKAADLLRYQLDNLSARGDYAEDAETTVTTAGGFDSACEHLLFAIHYGFAPAELMWGQDSREVFVDEILPKDLRRFFFVGADRGYKLRMHDVEHGSANGLVLPHRKFLLHRYASVPTEAPEGLGLGNRLFFPAWFKRQDVKFWLIFADKFATPTAIAKHQAGATKEQRQELLEMLGALATDAGIVVSKDVEVAFLEAARSSTIAVYADLVKFCDAEMSKAVLGETGTTDQQGSGGSRARDEVGNSIRIEIAKADSDLLSGTLNRTLARWITWFNFGDSAAVPRIWRRFPELEDKRDLGALAERDKIIVDMAGRPLTEKYLVETYEVEFEPKPEPLAVPPTPPPIELSESDPIDPMIAPVADGLADGDELADILPKMNGANFAEDLAQQMALAYLEGRYEVMREAEGEDAN
jgi:phage gp29-like protein